MDTGPFFSGTLVHPGGPTIKGLAIKLGDRAQAAICFDTELLRYSCGWTAGFLRFSPARYGLISPPAINGAIQFASPRQPGCSATDDFVDTRSNPPWGPLPADVAQYRGLSIHGSRIVLHYTIGTAQILESPWVESSEQSAIFTREFQIAPCDKPLRILLADSKAMAQLVGPAFETTIVRDANQSSVLLIPPHSENIRIKVALWNGAPAQQTGCQALVAKSAPATDLTQWTKPGPARWGAPLVTVGQLGTANSDPQAPFVLDTLTMPFDNPYRALMFASGHDFFANGDAAVCTAHGDVWLVQGIDAALKRITWKRFATGLFQPLGLKIISRPGSNTESIYVLGRDQITILHDKNRDGEADYYENFNNAGQATANSHEFATCLETDSKGNLYYIRGDSGSQTQHDGCLLRVSADGKQLDVFATGFRNANGLSIGPDDTITVAPQEGTWTPGSAIFEVQQGGFYGAMQSHHRPSPPTTYDPPLCWIPRQMDNSSGGQAWVPANAWKPLSGQLLHFSFGTCKMFLAVREKLGPQTQGGTIQLPLNFDSGVMRGRFRPLDQQLYVTGLKGWVSSAVQDGCFQRVRMTGEPVDLPVAMKTYSNGIALTFTDPLSSQEAQDPDNFSVEQWNYRWSGNYGSADYRVSNPNQVGHDEVEVVSSTLLADRRTVFLEMPDLKPAMQVSIAYTLASQRGRAIRQTFNATIHQLGESPQPEKLVRLPRPGQLAPEIESTLKPGLILQVKSIASDRLVNLTVSRLAAITPAATESRLAPLEPHSLTWQGYLKIPQKAEFQFRFAEGQQLKIDHQIIGRDAPVRLGRGYHVIEFTHLQVNPNSPESTGIRLTWKGEGFPWEAIPPNQLFHRSDDPELQQAEALHEGRDLFFWKGCTNCHATDTMTPNSPAIHRGQAGSLTLAPRRAGPVLEDLRSRLNPLWLAAWIENPQQLRPQALMPRLFHDSIPDLPDSTVEQQRMIADLVAFLTNTPPTAVSTKVEQNSWIESTDAIIEEGRRLYQAQGCMGCHRFTLPTEPDDYQRLSLAYVAAKFRPGALAAFLAQPQSHYPSTRMPNFHFTNHESQILELFLRSQATAELPTHSPIAEGNAARGGTLFAELGCQNCHVTSTVPKEGAYATLRAPQLASISLTAAEPDCVAATTSAQRSILPRFALTAAERAALRAYLTSRNTPAPPREDLRSSQRLMDRLNCRGCHTRDGENSPLGEIVAEEGDGLPVEGIPHLTWAGEKLRADWINRLLTGRLTYKTRPTLKARMPAFTGYGVLGHAIAREHGIEPIESHSPTQTATLDAPLAEAGRQLTLKQNGLDCRQCHGVGNEQPSGDKATLISPGINFSITADRMNFDFLPQLLLNPPRYDPSSRMPVFSVDGKTTAAKSILDGDAERQFQAIRQYLKTIPLVQ